MTTRESLFCLAGLSALAVGCGTKHPAALVSAPLQADVVLENVFYPELPPRPAIPNFTSDIEPIFDRYCRSCHHTDIARGGIRLDRESGIASAMARLHRVAIVLRSGENAIARMLPSCAAIVLTTSPVATSLT